MWHNSKLKKNRRTKLLKTFISFSLLFSNYVFSQTRPYPLLETTPQYVCDNLLLGKGYGAPANSIGLSIFETIMRGRYDIEVKGLTEILSRGKSGILFLSQHSGLVDPMIMMAAINRSTNVRPVMTENMTLDKAGAIIKTGAVLRMLTGGVNTILLPDAQKGGATNASLAEAVLGEVANAINHGDNILLYPSGNLQISSLERVGETTGVFELLKRVPNVRVVLVRQRGIWGSSWTHGAEASDPEKKSETGVLLQRGILTGIKTFLANGFVLTPKRPVTLEFAEPADFPKFGSKSEMNAFMDRYFNADPAESRTFVNYYFLSGLFGSKTVRPATQEIDYTKARTNSIQAEDKASEELKSKVLAITKTALENTDIDYDSVLYNSGLDSLSQTELITAILEQFNVELPDDSQFSTVRELSNLVYDAQASGVEHGSKVEVSEGWKNNPRSDKLIRVHEGIKNITEMIVRRALEEPDKVIAEDLIRGPFTYKKLLTTALAVSEELKGIDGKNLGILMPASSGNSLVYLATQLAGKVPVYVNFTTQQDTLIAGLDSIGTEKILTTRQIVSVVGKDNDLSKYMHRFVYLEDLKLRILSQMPRAFLRMSLFKQSIIEQARQADKTAVILFTSGSTGVPKAVPLTHENILSNVNDLTAQFEIKESDRLLIFAPPFHSFGHLLQVLNLGLGLPAFYHPKPKAAATIAQIIDKAGISIFLGPPSLVRDFALVYRGQSSPRLAVMGAEALRQADFDIIQRAFPQTTILEGYGATETSPVISVNPIDHPILGTVGKILPSYKYAVVDPETYKDVEKGQVGVLLVSGPAVFSGYLNVESRDAFIERDGLKYYITKDLVVERPDNYIEIKGKTTRFPKINGEMVSIPHLENILVELVEPLRPREANGNAVGGPLVAVVNVGDNKPIIAFTSVPLTLAQVQSELRARGMKGSHKIDEVRHIDSIPMLGTGKTDYKILEGIIKNN